MHDRVTRAFFRAFFPLLLGVVAASEWVTAAWLLAQAGLRLPPAAHPVAALAVFVANRALLAHRPGGRMGARALRVYTAIAFTSLFSGLYLAAAGLAWLVLHAAGAPVGFALGSVAPAGTDPGLPHVVAAGVNAGLAAIAGLFLAGYTAGRRQLAVTRLTVPIASLPPALDGFRIVQLSDLHVGAFLGREELAAHVARVNALAPDLVCITGDLVDRVETCVRAFPILAGLRAPHGILVTLGNHDVGAGAARVTEALRALTPFTVLRDAAVDIRVGGTRLAVAGLDDLGLDWARGVPAHPALPALARAAAGADAFVVLSHRPDCFPQAAGLGATLVLAGHTHGGQIGLPAWPGGRVRNLAEAITRFDRGSFRLGTALLYVNRGLGFTGQPIRLFTPREIAVFELRPAAPGIGPGAC